MKKGYGETIQHSTTVANVETVAVAPVSIKPGLY